MGRHGEIILKVDLKQIIIKQRTELAHDNKVAQCLSFRDL
jgi:hypothetical protein